MAPAGGSDSEIAELILDVVPGTMRVIRRLLREAAKGELTVPQLRILAHVSRNVTTAAELAELQGVSPAAISKMVDALANRGLLLRTRKEGDRKQIFLQLSPKGKSVYAKSRRAARDQIASLISQLKGEDKAQIQAGLEALREALACG
jgi:DNA-binding MarR family transcriptional regulator